MHHLARSVLVVVALFVAVVLALLVARSRIAPVESATSPAEPARADLHMKEVEIEEQSGNVRWRLTAAQALVYETEGRTSLRKVAVVVNGRDRTWTIVGDEGDVHNRSSRVRDVEVRRNVVVTTSDGYRLETSVLRWDGERRRIWTDSAVRLVGESGVVLGRDFELKTDDETSTLRHVRATFQARDDR